MHFTDIRPTEHYHDDHESAVPWHKVLELVYTTKNPRKKGDKFEIDHDGYYVLFEVKQSILYVINAKISGR